MAAFPESGFRLANEGLRSLPLTFGRAMIRSRFGIRISVTSGTSRSIRGCVGWLPAKASEKNNRQAIKTDNQGKTQEKAA